jgi:hypothetical protein
MNRTHRIWIGIGVISFVLAMCLSGLPAFGQSAQGDPQNSPSVDGQQGQNDQYPSGPDQNGQAPEPPANQAPVPSSLTLPAGTVLSVRTTGQLSSDRNQVGDQFSATLEQPLIANGWVVARRGQIVTGRVVVADKGSHSKPSQLGVQVIEVTLVDGQIFPVNTQLTRGTARPGAPPGRDVATVGTTTVLGAIIGAAAGGGTGAAIGAGLGATAGAAVVLSTRGSPTIIYPESLLTFRLDAPLQISTEQSQAAFQPVRQSDYAREDQDAYARPRLNRGPGPYGPYGGPGYYAAPYPYWYGAPYPYVPYVGFYGYYGGYYGPRFRGGFRR